MPGFGFVNSDSVRHSAVLNQVPEGALKFEGTDLYIYFEGDLTEEYITFETTN